MTLKVNEFGIQSSVNTDNTPSRSMLVRQLKKTMSVPMPKILEKFVPTAKATGPQ